MIHRINKLSCNLLRRAKPLRTTWSKFCLLFLPFSVLLITVLMTLSLRPHVMLLESSASAHNVPSMTKVFQLNLQRQTAKLEFDSNCTKCSVISPPPPQIKIKPSRVQTLVFPLSKERVKTKAGPYLNRELFEAEYQEMLTNFKIFVYPHVSMNRSSPLASIFLPHQDPMNPKIGNYFSEHAFKLALLGSSLVTQRPEEAHFFFMPFSINAMRNHPLLHSESSISSFAADYVSRISSQFPFWNASGGADHFFVGCHSVGRNVASKHFSLHNNAIQVTCSSSYFQRFYTAHKDIALPQVWPRENYKALNPPSARNIRVFFSGRAQNSGIRQELLSLWGNDSSFSMFSGHPSFPYEEGFKRSKYCLHVKGYEVNTARISDAIHYGCIPVLISNYYDLPYASILDWSKFSIIVHQGDVSQLKGILTSVSEQMYIELYENLCIVRKHFRWHLMPRNHDAFYMTAYQLWLRRGLNRIAD